MFGWHSFLHPEDMRRNSILAFRAASHELFEWGKNFNTCRNMNDGNSRLPRSLHQLFTYVITLQETHLKQSLWPAPLQNMIPATAAASPAFTAEFMFNTDLWRAGSRCTEHAAEVKPRCSASGPDFSVILSVLSLAGKTSPCCRRGNGKMLLEASQEVCASRCVRASQRKRGKSCRWLSDASFISRSHYRGKSQLPSSNMQKHGGQKHRFPHESAIVLQEHQTLKHHI